MIPFRATYTPTKWDKSGGFDGYDKAKEEMVLIVYLKSYDRETNPDVIFIHSDGRLDCATIPCFSQCQWRERE